MPWIDYSINKNATAWEKTNDKYVTSRLSASKTRFDIGRVHWPATIDASRIPDRMVDDMHKTAKMKPVLSTALDEMRKQFKLKEIANAEMLKIPVSKISFKLKLYDTIKYHPNFRTHNYDLSSGFDSPVFYSMELFTGYDANTRTQPALPEVPATMIQAPVAGTRTATGIPMAVMSQRPEPHLTDSEAVQPSKDPVQRLRRLQFRPLSPLVHQQTGPKQPTRAPQEARSRMAASSSPAQQTLQADEAQHRVPEKTAQKQAPPVSKPPPQGSRQAPPPKAAQQQAPPASKAPPPESPPPVSKLPPQGPRQAPPPKAAQQQAPPVSKAPPPESRQAPPSQQNRQQAPPVSKLPPQGPRQVPPPQQSQERARQIPRPPPRGPGHAPPPQQSQLPPAIRSSQDGSQSRHPEEHHGIAPSNYYEAEEIWRAAQRQIDRGFATLRAAYWYMESFKPSPPGSPRNPAALPFSTTSSMGMEVESRPRGNARNTNAPILPPPGADAMLASTAPLPPPMNPPVIPGALRSTTLSRRSAAPDPSSPANPQVTRGAPASTAPSTPSSTPRSKLASSQPSQSPAASGSQRRQLSIEQLGATSPAAKSKRKRDEEPTPSKAKRKKHTDTDPAPKAKKKKNADTETSPRRSSNVILKEIEEEKRE
ncbi:hypothetical protein LTR54_000812 [Friedmanniomyces endolithicus]|nr:hypothetical protein LTR54_000812 [Friedmanniomyces endolithicus]